MLDVPPFQFSRVAKGPKLDQVQQFGRVLGKLSQADLLKEKETKSHGECSSDQQQLHIGFESFLHDAKGEAA